MRGSARWWPAKRSHTASRASWQGVPPVHPDQEGSTLSGPPGQTEPSGDPSTNPHQSVPKRVRSSGLKGVTPKPKLRRTGHITIRLSKEERAALDAASERAGLMTGSYVRQVLFNAPMPRQVRRPPVDRRELSRLLGEAGRIGNNLNQIARAKNSGVPVMRSEVQRALDGLETLRLAVLAALGRGR